MKPGWLSIKKNPGKIKPMSTRNVVKKHLKEWNYDDDEEKEEKRTKREMVKGRAIEKYKKETGDFESSDYNGKEKAW